MLRTVLYLFLFIIGITLLRSVIGIVSKVLTGGSNPKPGNFASNARTKVSGGTLRKDPVCGIYIPENTAIRVDTGDGPQYFCSEECRSKFAAGAHA